MTELSAITWFHWTLIGIGFIAYAVSYVRAKNDETVTNLSVVNFVAGIAIFAAGVFLALGDISQFLHGYEGN